MQTSSVTERASPNVKTYWQVVGIGTSKIGEETTYTELDHKSLEALHSYPAETVRHVHEVYYAFH